MEYGFRQQYHTNMEFPGSDNLFLLCTKITFFSGYGEIFIYKLWGIMFETL